MSQPTHFHCRCSAATSQAAGFSLIELMVAITIAMVMSLAIFSTLATSEGKKRSLTATNDVGQVANFASYQLDRMIRSAGSGFAQSWVSTFGCGLKATKTGPGVILPFQGVMSAPFTALNTTLAGNYRMAPVIIVKDATVPGVSGKPSDALIIMSGSAGFGEVPTAFVALPDAAANPWSQLRLKNTVSFRGDDLVLIADQNNPTRDCIIEQVNTAFAGGSATTLPLDTGAYSGNPISGSNVVSANWALSSISAINLGSGTTSNPPNFSIIGVGDNNNLMSYDLLQMGTYNQPQTMADGVFEMHALYGLDTTAPTGNKTVDVWVDGSAPNDAATIYAGGASRVLQIRSIRVGLIMRTSLPEKTAVTQGPLVLFKDLPAAQQISRALVGAEKNYRYRMVEMTIPLRSVLLQ
jgi:type IV pilus assembly protein PilW